MSLLLRSYAGLISIPKDCCTYCADSIGQSQILNISQLRIAPDQYSMSGLAEKYEVEEALGIKMPEGDYNSIGGFMCTTIDRIPYVGEACTVETSAERIRFEISKVDERRVLQVEAFRSGKDGKEPKEYNEEDEERDKARAINVSQPV